MTNAKQPKQATPKLPPAADWRARPIESWNVSTYLAFITENTREKYGVDYSPGGGGSKQARWARERGILKNTQGRVGNRVLRRWLEICWREYRTNKPELYPYPTVTFCATYMDRHMAEAVAEIAREERQARVAAELEVDGDELKAWF